MDGANFSEMAAKGMTKDGTHDEAVGEEGADGQSIVDHHLGDQQLPGSENLNQCQMMLATIPCCFCPCWPLSLSRLARTG